MMKNSEQNVAMKRCDLFFSYIPVAVYSAIVFKFPISCVVDSDCYIEGEDIFLLFSFNKEKHLYECDKYELTEAHIYSTFEYINSCYWITLLQRKFCHRFTAQCVWLKIYFPAI